MTGGLGRIGRYGIVGIGSNLFCYAVFLGLIAASVPAVPASGGVYILGLTISYLLNRSWSFRSRGSHASDLPRFLLAYGIGLVFSLVSMWVLIRWMHPAFAQIVTTLAAALVIYTSLTILKFGGSPHHAD
ncbi:GtrA family protein [Oceaniovalibus guishaninsula JLT2003]|uniref:GtrA family protein n=1 Tax=Oceaniovalibus guishaninsula JLT2003 TaxID=1231392 RepID=K2H9F5_9RHOB|nr:GtrA family protein [Oceaniovalibus guishaninsula]EKE44163.1 GtrA family protein [Oceaniovalibus guishaninsula JLT2003]